MEPETLLALNSDMKLLHKSQIKLKMEAGQKFEELRNLMQQVNTARIKGLSVEQVQIDNFIVKRYIYDIIIG